MIRPENTFNLAESREDIYEALKDLLSSTVFSQPVMGSTTFRGFARKFLDADQIPPDQLPFLCQVESMPEKFVIPGNRLPAIRTIGARLWCWARTIPGNDTELGSSYLNWMTEGIENVLSPDSSGYGSPGLLTLGGLVQSCAIEGTILRFPGDTDNLALVIIPVMILWPDMKS